MVVRVWSQDTGCSNLKVMLDGTDEYWATSVNMDEAKSNGSWHWMFDYQHKRPRPVAQVDTVHIESVAK